MFQFNPSVFDMFRTSKCSSSGRTLIWIHERNIIKLHVQSSWGWTFGCSKHVEDAIIKLKHYSQKCVFCWFLLCMYEYIAMNGSDNVNFSREELISSENGQDQTDLVCKCLNEPVTYQFAFFFRVQLTLASWMLRNRWNDFKPVVLNST